MSKILLKPIQIDNIKLDNNVLLAPMAGISDKPYRELAIKYGAGLTVSEMMATNPDVWHTEKSRSRLKSAIGSKYKSIQILGNDPNIMAHAAKINVESGADIIDINMGCPAKKINKKLAGSSLLAYPKLVSDIISTIMKQVNVPITLKIRTGIDRNNINAIEIAKIAEDLGVKLLVIHGRTKNDLFKGNAEYDTISKVKESVNIPVIANGDIISPEKARYVLEYTKCDGIMIGRATNGNPWIIKEIIDNLSNNSITNITIEQKINDVINHLINIHHNYSTEIAYKIARKHMIFYMNYFGLNQFRSEFTKIESSDNQLRYIKKILNKKFN